MAPKSPNVPPDDIYTIDLKPYQGFLVDLPPGATRGMRTEQDGWGVARNEILTSQPKYGDRAGITGTDFNRFVAFDGQYGLLLAELPRVQKAVEVLKESRAYVDHQRHKLATQFANSAERHAGAEGRDPTLLTAYEKTIRYRGVVADKAVKTKKKNAEAKAAGGISSSSPAPAATPSPAKPAAPPATQSSEGMSRIPAAPPDAIFAIDLKPMKGFLVDLPPGATRGMRTVQEGWDDVAHEIVTNQPKYGDRAGITSTDFDRFVALNDQYAQIEEQLPIWEKAEEIVQESLAHLDNQRHKLLTQFADAAEEHASTEGGNTTLLTAYEKTIAYRAVSADKAVQTRKKNEEAKKAAGDAAGPTNG